MQLKLASGTRKSFPFGFNRPLKTHRILVNLMQKQFLCIERPLFVNFGFKSSNCPFQHENRVNPVGRSSFIGDTRRVGCNVDCIPVCFLRYGAAMLPLIEINRQLYPWPDSQHVRPSDRATRESVCTFA